LGLDGLVFGNEKCQANNSKMQRATAEASLVYSAGSVKEKVKQKGQQKRSRANQKFQSRTFFEFMTKQVEHLQSRDGCHAVKIPLSGFFLFANV